VLHRQLLSSDIDTRLSQSSLRFTALRPQPHATRPGVFFHDNTISCPRPHSGSLPTSGHSLTPPNLYFAARNHTRTRQSWILQVEAPLRASPSCWDYGCLPCRHTLLSIIHTARPRTRPAINSLVSVATSPADPLVNLAQCTNSTCPTAGVRTTAGLKANSLSL
jgi:hypothetical protein